jgi:endonuclease/exonuclease/phosphatase family metal-dependent hydrolase
MKLRLASYNIHAGVGTDHRFNPQRQASVLQSLNADVIALQEVVSVGPDGFALLDKLAAHCGMVAIAGPTMMRGDASYGNALLTRHPVSAVKRLNLDEYRYEPRGALAVELNIGPHHSLTVVTTHLGLRGHERRGQLQRLLEWLPEPRPLCLLGDFNEWLPWSRVLRKLHKAFGKTAAPATFPSRLPLLTLDRIYASPNSTIESLSRLNTPEARAASDHLPLLAEINLD